MAWYKGDKNKAMKSVLVTQRVEIIESYKERRDCADQRISEFISCCGYLPLLVPNNPDIVKKIIEEVNPAGIILTGGNSIVKYGGNAPERDDTDKILLEESSHRKIPLYGFCRGMQSILDYFGETLVNVGGHVAVRHALTWQKNSILDAKRIPQEANSYHNQGCMGLMKKELLCAARSEDGVIEAVIHKELPILGTMWHPEREALFRRTDIDLVRFIFGTE